MRRAISWVAALGIASVLVLAALLYSNGFHSRKNARYVDTSVSPDRKYSVERYDLMSNESSYLFRVFDERHRLIAEYTKHDVYYANGAAASWECDGSGCKSYQWNGSDDSSIELPPGWLDRVKSKIP